MDQQPERPSDKQPSKSVRTGIKVRAWQLWVAIAGVLGFFAGFLPAVDPGLAVVAICLAFAFVVTSGVAFWLQYTNNHGKHFGAYLRASVIILTGGIVCSGLYFRATRVPHMLLALEIGDPPASHLFLTNSTLRELHRVPKPTATNFNYALYARNCVIVPVLPGQSNAILRFYVRSASENAVSEMRLVAALPREWECSPDRAWSKANVFLELPDAVEMGLTNMQCLVTQVAPPSLYDNDGWYSPCITNFNVRRSGKAAYRLDPVALSLRSARVNEIIFTHLLFYQSKDAFKPFLCPVEVDTNGHPRFLLTRKLLEESQR